MSNKEIFDNNFDKKEIKMITMSVAGAALALALAGASAAIFAAGGAVSGGGGTTVVSVEPGGLSEAIVNSMVDSALGAAEAGGACGGLADLLAAGAIIILICWIAREVYGENNIKWKLFRSWTVHQSPKWFLNFYIKHGTNIAKSLKNKNYLKKIIKVGMDYIISNKLKAEYNFAI